MNDPSDPRALEILQFWFGTLDDAGLASPQCERLWFRSDPAIDAEVRTRFARDLAQAAGGERAHWEQSARGRLALIVLYDQFSRNIYRASAQAFAHDTRALALCLAGIGRAHDRALAPIERAFFYMPLQHSEERRVQERSVALYQGLLQSLAPAVAARLPGFLEAALEHREIIRRFGRFPHRNRALGRASTPAEREYLAACGRSFGQG